MVDIADSGIPTVGKNYTLICSVSGAEKLNPTIIYGWYKNTDSQTQLGTTLFFQSFTLSDAGRYTCNVSIGSDYLNGNISLETFQDVNLQG